MKCYGNKGSNKPWESSNTLMDPPQKYLVEIQRLLLCDDNLSFLVGVSHSSVQLIYPKVFTLFIFKGRLLVTIKGTNVHLYLALGLQHFNLSTINAVLIS